MKTLGISSVVAADMVLIVAKYGLAIASVGCFATLAMYGICYSGWSFFNK